MCSDSLVKYLYLSKLTLEMHNSLLIIEKPKKFLGLHINKILIKDVN